MRRTRILKVGAATVAAGAGVILALTSVMAHSTQTAPRHVASKSVSGMLTVTKTTGLKVEGAIKAAEAAELAAKQKAAADAAAAEAQQDAAEAAAEAQQDAAEAAAAAAEDATDQTETEDQNETETETETPDQPASGTGTSESD